MPYTLDTGEVRKLSQAEIRTILRAADAIIARGGRNLLSLMLKGSNHASIRKHNLNTSPSYGAFSSLAMDQVRHRVDWCIVHGYLDIIYEGRLPVIVFSRKGWEMEKQTLTAEFLKLCESKIHEDSPDLSCMREVNREVVYEVLEAIRLINDPKYIPLLEAWALTDYKKVRKEIARVIRFIMEHQKT